MRRTNSPSRMLVPYVMRRVPSHILSAVVPLESSPEVGLIALARISHIGRNTRLELVDGRRAQLHVGDQFATVFGNRYATRQFEGYAQMTDGNCDLLSVAGVCGTVTSRHSGIGEPTRLQIVGAFADPDESPLNLRSFTIEAGTTSRAPNVIAVVGSSMDSGKTHTAACLVRGLLASGEKVAAIKLTGTATGRDTWSFIDAGATPALDFVDGGYPATYLCTIEELMELYGRLLSHAVAAGAVSVVLELADGIFQEETAALLRHPAFVNSVHSWVFAAGDAVSAYGGAQALRKMGIEIAAVSGQISRSQLGRNEVEAATGLRCLSTAELERIRLPVAVPSPPVR